MSMAIRSASFGSGLHNINNERIRKSTETLSSGKRINSAADDASGLAISKKLEAMARGLNQGTDNSYNMQNLVNTAEGSLSTMGDSLQRIRELGVQANSGIYSESDKALIQEEVSQLKSELGDMAAGSQFNDMKLLDGSFQNMNAASHADGSGMSVSIDDMSLNTLGMENYDVTENTSSLNDVDNALNVVSGARADLGAQTNRLDFTTGNTTTGEVNQQDARSRIEDADLAKEITNFRTGNIIQQYKFSMQKNQMSNMGNVLSLMM